VAAFSQARNEPSSPIVDIGGAEHHRCVLVDANLDQALQVPQLQRERVGHHDVGRFAERCGSQ
jgi:hypothetical protein